MIEVDLDDLMMNYIIVRSALETLAYDVSEGTDVGKALVGARVALQWTLTVAEIHDDCECEH